MPDIRLYVPMALLLALPQPARAELDPGPVYVYSHGLVQGAADAHFETDGIGRPMVVERWYVPLRQTFRAESLLLRAAPHGGHGASPRPPCTGLAEYSLRYAYEPVTDELVDEVVDTFASLDVPRLADRVEIDGDVVGWRLRSLAPDGTITEAWFLTHDYAPPLPGGGVAPTASAQNGWLRPYADAVHVEPASVDVILDELLAADTPYRLARASYLPRPARCTD